MTKLKEFSVDHYFLYPQINWNAKHSSLKRISELLNIGIDSIAFIDDEIFEREEVRFNYPEVLCLDVTDLDRVLLLPEMTPRFITEDSKIRRVMYLNDLKRDQAEEKFVGTKEEFLYTLNMVLTISEAGQDDLRRAEELTVRTNQLNTTGYTYSYDELDFFRKSPQHKLLMASLADKFGTYGKIGLALIETKPDIWVIKLLLMSCRVMSRGVGTTMITHIRQEARRHNVRLHAEMISNDRNRMMYMTFKFTHFREKENRKGLIILENDLAKIQEFPDYVEVSIEP
jgi:FkbH-like protein